MNSSDPGGISDILTAPFWELRSKNFKNKKRYLIKLKGKKFIFVLPKLIKFFTYFLQDDVETIVSGKMKESMKNYNNSSAGGVKETWDVLQKDVKCCGTMSYTDWATVDGFGQNSVPDSCCKVR